MNYRTNNRDLLNLNHLDLTNQTFCLGQMGFPALRCILTEEFPDYIALYTQPGDYKHTKNTCIAFYNFDKKFNGQNGLLNAIQYKNKKDLDFFKKRLSGHRFFLMPDISVFGDVQPYRNYYNMGTAREAAIWLTTECDGIVIPTIPYANREYFKFMLESYDNVNTLGISTKGKLNHKEDMALMKDAIIYTVNNLPLLETFIVYDVSVDNKKAHEVFSYAIEKGVRVIIPDNKLKLRNRIKWLERHSHEQHEF